MRKDSETLTRILAGAKFKSRIEHLQHLTFHIAKANHFPCVYAFDAVLNSTRIEGTVDEFNTGGTTLAVRGHVMGKTMTFRFDTVTELVLL